MELKAGARLRSAVCDAEVMVIKAVAGDELTCGGVAMLPDAPADKVDGVEDQMNECVFYLSF